MEKHMVSSGSSDRGQTVRSSEEPYHSVEFSVGKLDYLHQFKIWRGQASPMSFLVKEGSEILENLKIGDRISMKYYSENSIYPTDYLDSEIRDISKEDQGKFRGHVFVHFSILDN